MIRRRGFALIAALWLLVALSAAGLELARHSRAYRLTGANLLEGQRADGAARAGLEHARSRLAELLNEARTVDAGVASARRLDPWVELTDAMPDSVALGTASYRVGMHDNGARLDVNRAGEEDLRRLMLALRIDAGEADRIAQAIADWRDADDFRRGRGAERDEYVSAGANVLPPNRPFERVSELRHVRGVTPELLERLRRLLTVIGGGQVNINAAPREVLLALPGMTEQAVAVLLRYRQQRRRLTSLDELALELPEGPRRGLVEATPALLARTTFETREVHAVSEGRLPGSPVRSRMAALLARGGQDVFVVWRAEVP